MSFIDRVVGPDEKKIGIVTAHWIYGMIGLMWLLGMIALGFLINIFVLGFIADLLGGRALGAIAVIGGYTQWITLAIGALCFFLYVIKMISTEIGLTDKRVILKKGLLFVDVKEIDIEEIKAANVDNGIFGRFLNYGYLFLDSRFVENIQIPAIGDPYRFVKALNEARSIRQDDSMHVVLEEKGAAVKSHMESEHNDQDHSHRLDEARYKSTEDNPAKAMHNVKQETHKNISKQKQATRKKEKLLHDEEGREHKPVIFKKEQIREEIIEDFDESNAKTS